MGLVIRIKVMKCDRPSLSLSWYSGSYDSGIVHTTVGEAWRLTLKCGVGGNKRVYREGRIPFYRNVIVVSLRLDLFIVRTRRKR